MPSASVLPIVLYRAEQVRELDRLAIQEYAIPGLCLMERAGTAAFACLHHRWPEARRIAVLCGIGNNAGDGYVLARLAHLAGYRVSVLQVGDSGRLKGDALGSFQAMQAVGVTPQTFSKKLLQDIDVAVDALFGTGLDRPVGGPWLKAIDLLNRRVCPVLAIDIPSGLHADTGAVLGTAVQADATLSFIGLKQGLFTGAGPDYCGDIYFDDLQVPPAIYSQVAPAALRLDAGVLHSAFGERPRTAHKGNFGHVLVIGGEQGYIGAARLAAEAALRVGAGKVSLATRQSHAALISLTCPEIMSHGVESPEALAPLAAQVDVVALGPGLGQGAWGQAMLEAAAQLDKPLVVDADALNLLAKKPLGFKHAIFTPHPGEAARLLETSTAQIQANRFDAAQTLHHRFGGVWVLKGAGTLIGDGHSLALCSAGNPGMASGGMGDLLTGVIAGLCGQGFSAADAARLGVCLHAAAADRAAEQGERGMLPSDVLPWLRAYANPGVD